MIRRYCGTARKNGALTSPPRASDPFIATPRLAEMPFRRGGSAARECHLYFARRVTFLTCADNDAVARIERNPTAGLPAPRPYPTLARPGRVWIKVRSYWVAYGTTNPPVILAVFYGTADMPGRI